MVDTRKEWDRRKSVESVGQLYPILLAKDGKVIDGLHRLEEDPDWRTETLEHIDTDEKLLLARAASNWHRRIISRHERKAWISGLAQLYLDQGLKVVDLDHTTSGLPANQIVDKIKQELGLSHPTIMRYLDDRYKQKPVSGKKTGPRAPASKVINNLTKGRASGDLVKRHRKEIMAELLHDEDFRRRMSVQIALEVREGEEEEDPDAVAITTLNFENMVHHYQDELRQIDDNPAMKLSGILNPGDRRAMRRNGLIIKAMRSISVNVLTEKTRNILNNIKQIPLLPE